MLRSEVRKRRVRANQKGASFSVRVHRDGGLAVGIFSQDVRALHKERLTDHRTVHLIARAQVRKVLGHDHFDRSEFIRRIVWFRDDESIPMSRFVNSCSQRRGLRASGNAVVEQVLMLLRRLGILLPDAKDAIQSITRHRHVMTPLLEMPSCEIGLTDQGATGGYPSLELPANRLVEEIREGDDEDAVLIDDVVLPEFLRMDEIDVVAPLIEREVRAEERLRRVLFVAGRRPGEDLILGAKEDGDFRLSRLGIEEEVGVLLQDVSNLAERLQPWC